MESLIALISKNPLVIAITGAIVIIIIAGILTWKFTKRTARRRSSEETTEEITPFVKSTVVVPTGATIGGKYKAMVIRSAARLGLPPGTNVIDFTSISQPVGEIHIADTSCPISGGIFTVKETDEGEIIDYDPREVPMVVEETPEYAWFATHWEIVGEVFSVPTKWWATTSTWFVAGVLVILFFVSLSALGG